MTKIMYALTLCKLVQVIFFHTSEFFVNIVNTI